MKDFKVREVSESKVEVAIDGPCGTRTMVINATIPQMKKALFDYGAGAYIQQAFSFLSAGEREFLMSGITPEEFDKMFADAESGELL